jgi:hypothetical protein
MFDAIKSADPLRTLSMNKVNFPFEIVLPSEVSMVTSCQNGLASLLSTLSLALVIMMTGISAVGFQTACAGTPPLGLSLNASGNVHAGKPMDNVEINLVNPGKEAVDSRLRLFIHDLEDREVQTNDIKIEIREKQGWRQLSVEVIDGGVMTSIGKEGNKDNENHKKGGFHINKNANQVWQIRLTFRLPGQYTLVVAVSPDNGSSHLAKPANMKIEVL